MEKLYQHYNQIYHLPLQVEMAKKILTGLHNRIQTCMYRNLQPESAYHSMSAIRGVLPFLLIGALSPVYKTLIAGGTVTFFKIKAKDINDHAQIKILNSIAIAFFFTGLQSFSQLTHPSQLALSLINTPINFAFSGIFFHMASQVESQVKLKLAKVNKNTEKEPMPIQKNIEKPLTTTSSS